MVKDHNNILYVFASPIYVLGKIKNLKFEYGITSLQKKCL